MREKILFIVLLWLNMTVSAQDTTSVATLATNPADSVIPIAPTVPPSDSTSVAVAFVAYNDSGIASWYGPNWEGRLTASGEYFSPDSMTAAHKYLPFGTIVKVTNLANDSVVYVRITDRLPKSSKRSIDLTPAAAKKLGFYSRGLQKVKMETVGMVPVQRKTKSVGAVQR